MKLTELRPCDACSKPIGFVFFRLQVQQHVVSQRAVQQRVGLATMFGGNERLASVFDGDPADATGVASDLHLLLCNDCFCSAHLVAAAWEKRSKAAESKVAPA
jgi:hypothetical protein